jgi:sec-independent protein translocase protein TatB
MLDFGFGVGYSEMFVLALIAVIVIGPKDLPRVLRTFGQFMRKARGMAREFQTHVDAAMKDAGVDGLKKDFQSLKSIATSPALQDGGVVDFKAKTPSDFGTYFADGPGEARVAGEPVGTTVS